MAARNTLGRAIRQLEAAVDNLTHARLNVLTAQVEVSRKYPDIGKAVEPIERTIQNTISACDSLAGDVASLSTAEQDTEKKATGEKK